MFRTMPSLSSVWNVKGTSAGILARKLVSGVPSGAGGCGLPPLPSGLRTEGGGRVAVGVGRLCHPSLTVGARTEVADRDFAENTQPLVGEIEEFAGNGTGRRSHGHDADRVDVAVGIQADVGALSLPGLAVADREGIARIADCGRRNVSRLQCRPMLHCRCTRLGAIV